jgi:hypothetical protein
LNNLGWSPSATGLYAISINANNVVLDLNGHTITQSTFQNGSGGVLINGNNVLITGGTLRNFTKYGAVINPGSYDIILDEVKILETGLTNGTVTSAESVALLSSGTSFSSNSTMIRNLILKDCDFSFGQTSLSSTSSTLIDALAGVYIQYTQDAIIHNCIANFLNGPSVLPSLAGFSVLLSKDIHFSNSESSFNSSGSRISFGFHSPQPPGLVETFGLSFENCTANSSTSTGNAVFGIGVGFIRNIEVINCVSSNNTCTGTNTAPGNGAFGICLIKCTNGIVDGMKSYNHTSENDACHGSHAVGCINVVYKNSHVANIINTVGSASGYGTVRNDLIGSFFNGSTVTWQNNVVTNVQAGNLVNGPSVGAVGFSLHDTSDSYVSDNVISDIIGTSVNGWGILVDESSSGNTHNLSINNNKIDNNSSYGIQDKSTADTGSITNASNRYYNNFAQNNATANYDIPNLIGTGITSYATLLSSGTTNPFTNISVP